MPRGADRRWTEQDGQLLKGKKEAGRVRRIAHLCFCQILINAIVFSGGVKLQPGLCQTNPSVTSVLLYSSPDYRRHGLRKSCD